MLGMRCFVIGLASLIASSACAIEPFRFVHITDTHVGSSQHGDIVRSLLDRLRSENRPAFIINTGDATELGTTEEFAAYSDAIKDAPAPVYTVPGNHDVRWAPTGKEAFARACGPAYRAFEYGGCWFYLLDSTVVLEHWGHFDSDQLRRLATDLRKMKRGAPAFIFFHHWLGREKTNIDNAAELLTILAPYNIAAIFVGHGHSDLQWQTNGIPSFMARGLYQGSHHEIVVEGDTARVLRVIRADGRDQYKEIAVLDLRPRERPVFKARWLGRATANGKRRFQARWTGGGLTPSSVYAWAVDGRVAGEGRPDADGWFRHEVDLASLQPGHHDVTVTATEAGRTFTESLTGLVSASDAGARMLWERRADSTIQGSVSIGDNTAYVGSVDHQLYAIHAATGRVLWRYRTNGAIFATPCVSGALVLIGSMDHYLYAIDRKSGRLRWKYDTGAPVLASAAAAGGIACIGGNRFIHGIDLESGAPRWRTSTGSFFQSRCGVGDGKFILGGWDNTLYALDIATGSTVWKQQMGRTNGGRGRLSFYYSPAITSPAVTGDRVYVCTNDGVLHCLALSDGSGQWITRAPADGDVFGYSSPIVCNGKVILGGLGEEGRGDCYAVDAANGALVWRCATGADNYDSGPALIGDLIAIGSVSGRVSWISPGDGRLVGAYVPRPGYSFSTPAAYGRTALTASMNGYVTAIQAPATLISTR